MVTMTVAATPLDGTESSKFPENHVLDTVLGAVRDRTRYIDEAGLYLLLDRVSKAPKKARTFVWKEVMEEPARFRGQWIGLSGRLAESKVGALTNKKRWDGDVFISHIVEDRSGNVVTFVGTRGSALPRGTHVRVEGYFFKLRVDEPRSATGSQPVEEMVVPVVVGDSLKRIPLSTGNISVSRMLYLSLGVIGGLFCVYLYLRRRLQPARARIARNARASTGTCDPSLCQPIDLDSFFGELPGVHRASEAQDSTATKPPHP